MKATLTEYYGCFSIELEAETLAEAAIITRAGMNSTKELRSLDAYVGAQDGTFVLSTVLAKSKKANGNVPKRK